MAYNQKNLKEDEDLEEGEIREDPSKADKEKTMKIIVSICTRLY